MHLSKNLVTNEEVIMMTIDEIRALYRVLEHEYIPYDEMEAMQALREMRQIIEDWENQKDGTPDIGPSLAENNNK